MENFSPIGNINDNRIATGNTNTNINMNVVTGEKPVTNNIPIFQNGQALSGHIIDLLNKDITIQLNNENIIKATLLDTLSINLNIGDTISFTAQTLADGTITVEPIKSYSDSQLQFITKALQSSGIPQNDKSIAVVKELLDNGMPIDKNTVSKILIQSNSNKNISITNLVLMNKLNIPVTHENAKQFSDYRVHEHRILNQLTDIADNINNVLNSKETPSQIVSYNTEFVNIITNNPNLSSKTNEQDLNNIITKFNVNSEITQLLEQTNFPKEFTADNYNPRQILNHLSELPKEIISTLPDSSKSLLENINNSFQEYISHNNEISLALGGEAECKELASIISKYTPDENIINQFKEGALPSKEALVFVNKLLNQLPEEEASSIIKSKPYQSLMKSSIIGEWTLSPKDLIQEDKIKEKYDNIYENLNKLGQLMQKDVSVAADKLSSSSQNAKNNLDFMNTINEMFSYIQLPLRLKGQNVHSDLYVMTNKKKLAKDNSNISVLLHLDMQFLKPLDIKINLQNNSVDAKFYMSDDFSKKLVETNIESLENALLSKGYLLTHQIIHEKKEIDIVKDFLEADSSTTKIKRYSFDIRA